MELDDLRQRWRQQPPAATPPLTPEAMQAMLSQPSANPLWRIRRNARWEAAAALICLPIAAAVMLLVHHPYPRAMALWLALICLGSLYYLYQKRRVLDQLQPPAGALRQQLQQQVDSLRRLVQVYYRATLLTLFGSFGIGFVMQVHKYTQTTHGSKLALMLGVLVLTYALLIWLGYRALQEFTRWYLQRLYGQHLDRLEGYLRDLQDPE